MARKHVLGALLLASVVVAPSWAQVAKPAPTPTPGASVEEDPWERWVREYYQVVAVPRGTELRLGGNLARPHPRVNAVMEIVGEDEQFVYLRNLPLEDPRSAGHKAWLVRQGREVQQEERAKFFEGKYLIAREPLLPPRLIRKLRFEDQSAGLPQAGLWQMGFALADMDGDGVRDLAVPPARKGEPHPWIFLRKDQRWVPWGAARWPEGPAYDYGDVKVADFDGDGHLDLALACHFKPSYVLYGDGRGWFSRWVQLPRANGSVTSRALAVADFNRDGRPDIVTLAELDLDLGTNQAITSGLVNVVLNTKEGWKLSPASFPRGVYGDHVAVGDFDGDGSPDILTASHKGGNDFYIFLNDGRGQAFTPYRSDALPIQSFVLGVAAGSLDGKKPDQVILAVYQSLRPKEGEHSYAHALLAYRLAKKPGRLLPSPERTVIYADQTEPIDSFRDVAVGDLDGDGRQDVVALRASGAVQVFLQLPDGGFALEQSDLGIPGSSPSSVAVAKEKESTYIVANFSEDTEQKGGLRVWKVTRR
jgi:hypothetical protein